MPEAGVKSPTKDNYLVMSSLSWTPLLTHSPREKSVQTQDFTAL